MDTIAGEGIARDAAASAERNREERWASDRADSESLRSGLEKGVDDVIEAPRRPVSLKDEEGNDLDLRGYCEQAYDSTFVDAKRAEREKKEYDDFRALNRDMKRTHGMDVASGTRKLMEAERTLRSDPGHALQFLSQAYGDGRIARETEQRTRQNATAEVEAFFRTYKIPEAYESLMTQAIQEGKITPTGDTERDLSAAYHYVHRSMNNVRLR